jgi:hypothetical protein
VAVDLPNKRGARARIVTIKPEGSAAKAAGERARERPSGERGPAQQPSMATTKSQQQQQQKQQQQQPQSQQQQQQQIKQQQQSKQQPSMVRVSIGSHGRPKIETMQPKR